MREFLKDQIWWWLMLVTLETSGLRDKVENKRDFFLEQKKKHWTGWKSCCRSPHISHFHSFHIILCSSWHLSFNNFWVDWSLSNSWLVLLSGKWIWPDLHIWNSISKISYRINLKLINTMMDKVGETLCSAHIFFPFLDNTINLAVLNAVFKVWFSFMV